VLDRIVAANLEYYRELDTLVTAVPGTVPDRITATADVGTMLAEVAGLQQSRLEAWWG
jgi:hypothetical protein